MLHWWVATFELIMSSKVFKAPQTDRRWKYPYHTPRKKKKRHARFPCTWWKKLDIPRRKIFCLLNNKFYKKRIAILASQKPIRNCSVIFYIYEHQAKNFYHTKDSQTFWDVIYVKGWCFPPKTALMKKKNTICPEPNIFFWRTNWNKSTFLIQKLKREIEQGKNSHTESEITKLKRPSIAPLGNG